MLRSAEGIFDREGECKRFPIVIEYPGFGKDLESGKLKDEMPYKVLTRSSKRVYWCGGSGVRCQRRCETDAG